MVTVEINTTQLTQQLDLVAYRQLPFATARALTQTAYDVRDQGKAELPQHFIIRRNWVAKGFRVTRATKQREVATIGHKDQYMILQETGGEKHAQNKTLAVPEGARPTPQSVTPPSTWPGRLRRRFYVKRGDRVEEFVRIGRKSRGKKRKHAAPRGAGTRDPNVRLMYLLKPMVRIKPRWGFAQMAARVAGAKWPNNFARFLEEAIRTAK